ncbi:FAD-dependent oxidoreductase [Streptomyces xanthochromogenes]
MCVPRSRWPGSDDGRRRGGPRRGPRRRGAPRRRARRPGRAPPGLTLALLLLKSGVRVTVVERSRSHQREFRGEILQPGAMTVLDRLWRPVRRARARLPRARPLPPGRAGPGAARHRLPRASAPYDHLLSIPQSHLLTELLLHCAEFADFEYVDGCRVNALLRDERGRITGAAADGHVFHSKVVVGADGRFSKVRRLAGIGYRVPGAPVPAVRGRRVDGAVLAAGRGVGHRVHSGGRRREEHQALAVLLAVPQHLVQALGLPGVLLGRDVTGRRDPGGQRHHVGVVSGDACQVSGQEAPADYLHGVCQLLVVDGLFRPLRIRPRRGSPGFPGRRW